MMRTNDGLVKQEVDDGVPSPASDSDFYPPLPLQGLHDPAPPPFLNKTYDMVDDPNTDEMVSWSLTGGSFIVWDSNRFSIELLPKFFKHNNFSSFVRQLNTYGFRKVDPDRWEFASEGFFRGQKHLLITIKRRKPPSQTTLHQAIGACVEVGHFGLEGEIDRLKRDKAVLMSELVKLRQQQQNTRDYMKAMEERLQGTEQKQHQMMTFLARAMQNPTFVMQMLQQSEKRKELEEAISKKRRRQPIEGRAEEEEGRGLNGSTAEELAGQQGILLDMVSGDLEDGFDFDLSDLERIETELKGEIERDDGEEQSVEGASSAGLGFLNELWGGGYLRNRNPNGVVGDGGERNTEFDVRLLTEKLGFLGSSRK